MRSVRPWLCQALPEVEGEPGAPGDQLTRATIDTAARAASASREPPEGCVIH